jgi:limonene-1,2-epoxide hydrolase
MSVLELVTTWCTKWPGMPADEVAEYFAPKAEWVNMPTPDRSTVGPEAIAAGLEGFLARVASVDIEVHHAAASADGVVLVERTETFVFPGGESFKMPVAAVFETADGRITAWRDYFDMAQFTSKMPAGA